MKKVIAILILFVAVCYGQIKEDSTKINLIDAQLKQLSEYYNNLEKQKNELKVKIYDIEQQQASLNDTFMFLQSEKKKIVEAKKPINEKEKLKTKSNEVKK